MNEEEKKKSEIKKGKINEFASGLERRFSLILEKHGLIYSTQYAIYYEKDKFKTYDFHLTDSNILIEVQGDFFHGNPEIFKHQNTIQNKNIDGDAFKKKLAYEKGFLLVEIWQREIVKNPDYVNCIVSELNDLKEPEPLLVKFKK